MVSNSTVRLAPAEGGNALLEGHSIMSSFSDSTLKIESPDRNKKAIRLPTLTATTSIYAEKIKEAERRGQSNLMSLDSSVSLSGQSWASPFKKAQGTDDQTRFTSTESIRPTHSGLSMDLRSPRRIPLLHDDKNGEIPQDSPFLCCE
jgi:hypothetical protein